jgi:RimJ/RimL family protein N-acetyltransferase
MGIDVAGYSAIETLRNGKQLEIRALHPEDRDDLLTAVGRASPQTLYRRFFGARRDFSEKEMSFFLNVDFINHVALVAIVKEDGEEKIIGSARYIITSGGEAEVAFAVIDQYQRQGVGATLMRHVGKIARAAGLTELQAEVLADNVAMLRVFEKSGYRVTSKREADIVHVTMRLP